MASFDEMPICLSGGAEGADLQWGMVAGSSGHKVFHFIFEGHRSRAPSSELVVITEDLLVLADEHLFKANETVKRRVPSNPFVRNLLRRNWYQVKDSESVYAVSSIKVGMVDGGTAWATAMFMDRHDRTSGIPVYVYDQTTSKWFSWNGGWTATEEVPKPCGVWTGVGSRKLETNGKEAIRELLGWKKP